MNEGGRTRQYGAVARRLRRVDARRLRGVYLCSAARAVLVSEVDGRPAPDGSEVALTLVHEDEARNPELARGQPSWSARTSGGRALFRWVEPARTWQALAARPGSNVRSRSTRRETLGAEPSEGVSGEVSWRPSGSEASWKRRDFSGDRIELLSADGLLDVEVRPRGHRSGLLTGVTGRRNFGLHAPLRVRLELATEGPLPAYPLVFDPVLMREDVHVGKPDGPAFFTERNRSILFLVSSPGRALVRWHLERRGEGWAVGGYVLEGHAREIEILDVPGEQSFRIELDSQALRALVPDPPW